MKTRLEIKSVTAELSMDEVEALFDALGEAIRSYEVQNIEEIPSGTFAQLRHQFHKVLQQAGQPRNL